MLGNIYKSIQKFINKYHGGSENKNSVTEKYGPSVINLLTVIAITIIFVILYSITFGAGISILLKLALIFLLSSFVLFVIGKSIIKIETTYKGILVFWGKRTDIILNEGYHIIVPIIFDVIIIDCKRKTENFKIDKIFTPNDQAEIVVDIELTWFPHNLSLFYETKDPIEQLNGMIAEGIRGYVSNPNTVPHEWDEAVGMSEKFARMVVAKLLGIDIPKYEEDVKDESGRIVHRKNEHKIEADLEDEEKNAKKLTIEITNKLKTGEGALEVPGIGIVVSRFNVKAVEPSEALRRSLEKISSEQQQQLAESVESRTTARIIREFLLELGYQEKEVENPNKILEILHSMGLSVAEFLRMSRVEREKASERVHQFVFSGDNSFDDILTQLARKAMLGGK